MQHQLQQQGRESWPAEACWALGGDASGGVLHLRQAVPLPNRADGSETFAAAAADFARAEHQLRATGWRWLGFAHTHPGGPAGLSHRDRRELWHDCLQLVLALPAAFATAIPIAAFWLRADGVHPLPLEYCPS